jgi:hypothetical protein
MATTHAHTPVNHPVETRTPPRREAPVYPYNDPKDPGQRPEPRRGGLLRLLGRLSPLIFIVMALTFADVIVWVDGVPKLHPKREQKLEKEIREIDDAEQYALIALVEGLYDCLTCPTGKIYLYPGNIWKYGVTRKGMKSRYGSDYIEGKKLVYVVQFEGNYALCLIEEKRKIYYYPLLKENLLRQDSQRLVYPPGNIRDN